MKKIKNKIPFMLMGIVLVLFFVSYFYNIGQCFFLVDGEKTNISVILEKESLSEEDYLTLFEQTGVAPAGVRGILEEGDGKILKELNEAYFEEPEIEKEFLAFPVTVVERNKSRLTPLVKLEKGDILVSFNTHTVNWRHGHAAMVIDERSGLLLEHRALGLTSCLTRAEKWGEYPSFAVLRYPDKEIAEYAADYAKENLVGIDYNIFTGFVKKDKSNEEEVDSSHCSHIVWQAYKAAGVDIDSNGGMVVTPKDIAMSEELKVVQIYGLSPKDYSSRIMW